MSTASPLPRAPHAPLGLIPFVVPDWPTARCHAQALDGILRHGPVAWEIAVPSAGWSARTGGVIARALADTSVSLDRILSIAARLRPNVAVLYEGLFGALAGRDQLLDHLAGRIDHVMLEWDPPDREAWRAGLARRGIGWVQTADARQILADDIAPLCDPLAQGSMFYVACARATGSETYDIELLRAAIRRVKGRRADLFVMVGFGIRTADQVRDLGQIDGLDAVAVGTALLEHSLHGAAAVDAFFATLAAAAASPGAPLAAERASP